MYAGRGRTHRGRRRHDICRAEPEYGARAWDLGAGGRDRSAELNVAARSPATGSGRPSTPPSFPEAVLTSTRGCGQHCATSTRTQVMSIGVPCGVSRLVLAISARVWASSRGAQQPKLCEVRAASRDGPGPGRHRPPGDRRLQPWYEGGRGGVLQRQAGHPLLRARAAAARRTRRRRRGVRARLDARHLVPVTHGIRRKVRARW
jgi:hypothetical protein